MSWGVLSGDAFETLCTLPGDHFHALFCDPPYGLKFMGKAWDVSVPGVDVWAQAFRVLRPGAHLLAFGGTRTFHRLACTIEDAGFELRDVLCWLYGSGFPKSLDVSKAIDDTSTDLAKQWNGYGTALKPSWEPIILARKPLGVTVAANVAKWGTGGIAIDASRIGDGSDRIAGGLSGEGCWGELGAGVSRPTGGRWPANVLLDEDAAALLDEQAGDDHPGMSGGGVHRSEYQGGMFGGIDSAHTARGDIGGPSRFFYTAKVSKEERDLGCAHMRKRSAGDCVGREDGSAGMDSPRAGASRTSGAVNHHPTLKPIELTSYLAKLLLPPAGKEPRRMLVPFSGTGSEMIGCIRAGWDDVTGIEREPDYIEIAKARIVGDAPLFNRTEVA